ncbi:ras-domain-containing protein [Hesseltinella vesiculosa]|uniref:Ras-domain-containing protein n=1 Tax=Hesseltinella vesiculosa TaxID=101127 RepID=A0A1X2GU14_9FUNG|nr:ras-domain-containing protein [Hesseltinella vesiculosa]
MASLYYRGAQAAILVYDITSVESFEELHSWIQELKQNTGKDTIIYIVGNKVDRASERRVSLKAVKDYVQKILGPFYAVHEVSAKEDDGQIEDLFLQLARTLVNQQYDPSGKQTCPSLLSEYDESVARTSCC